MTQNASDFCIRPETIICICAKSELDGLTSINVEAEEMGLLVRGKFRQCPDGELVLPHHM